MQKFIFLNDNFRSLTGARSNVLVSGYQQVVTLVQSILKCYSICILSCVTGFLGGVHTLYTSKLFFNLFYFVSLFYQLVYSIFLPACSSPFCMVFSGFSSRIKFIL